LRNQKEKKDEKANKQLKRERKRRASERWRKGGPRDRSENENEEQKGGYQMNDEKGKALKRKSKGILWRIGKGELVNNEQEQMTMKKSKKQGWERR
jgi:hypothetical protein